MAKFIQIQSPTDRYTGSTSGLDSYYINVELIRYVAENGRTQIDLRYTSWAASIRCRSSNPRPVLLVEPVPAKCYVGCALARPVGRAFAVAAPPGAIWSAAGS